MPHVDTDCNSETTMPDLQALEKVFKEYIQHVEVKTNMEWVCHPLLHSAVELMGQFCILRKFYLCLSESLPITGGETWNLNLRRHQVSEEQLST